MNESNDLEKLLEESEGEEKEGKNDLMISLKSSIQAKRAELRRETCSFFSPFLSLLLS